MSDENDVDAGRRKEIASSFNFLTARYPNGRRCANHGKRCANFYAVTWTVALLTATSLVLTSCSSSSSPVEKRREGMALFDSGDYVAALELLQESNKVDHADPLTHQYLAMCHERLEQFPQAKEEYGWSLRNAETKAERERAKDALDRLEKEASGTIKPRIVLLTADWCSYSKKFVPTFNRVADSYKGKVDFIAIDIEKPERKEMKETYDNFFREKYGETGVPSFVSECREGTIVDSTLGAIEEGEFRNKLDDLVKCPN